MSDGSPAGLWLVDMIKAIATIDGQRGYLEPILQTTLGGLRPPNDGEPT